LVVKVLAPQLYLPLAISRSPWRVTRAKALGKTLAPPGGGQERSDPGNSDRSV
jgi:hypothetical protein